MLRRILALTLALALVAPAAASAQQDPFGPLPQPQPTPAPTVEPTAVDDGSTGRTTLYIIAGALLVAFVGIGMFISRDARRAIPKDHRGDPHRLREHGPHRHERKAKAKARAKTKAQRAARRQNR